MSFILDALKKSENERQRTIGPSLADAPIRRVQTDRPWWVFAVGALLLVNLIVLVVVLTRDHGASTAVAPAASVPVGVPTPAAQAPTATPAPPARSQPQTATNPAVRSLADEADPYADNYSQSAPETYSAPDNPDLAAAAAVPDGPPMVRSIEAPAVAPLPNQSVFESRQAQEALPTWSTLTAGGAVLPELRLDIHVYSTVPTERFVFVNMRKYLEGQTLNEGAVVERIRADGAVLNYQGTRFLLPRQ
jgi:general secretion pathway protein B